MLYFNFCLIQNRSQNANRTIIQKLKNDLPCPCLLVFFWPLLLIPILMGIFPVVTSPPSSSKILGFPGIPRNRVMQLIRICESPWRLQQKLELRNLLDCFPISYKFVYVHGTVKQKSLTSKLLLLLKRKKKHDES